MERLNDLRKHIDQVIVEREAYLDEDIGEVETEDGWLRKGHLYRHNGSTYRLERVTRRGWYAFPQQHRFQRLFPGSGRFAIRLIHAELFVRHIHWMSVIGKRDENA